MNEQERNLLLAAAKYFEILHASVADLDSRVRALEQSAKVGSGALRSAYPASLSLQLSAVQQQIEKILR